MSTIDSYTIGGGSRQGSEAPAYGSPVSSMDPNDDRHTRDSLISPLQPFAYDPTASKRPLISTNVEQYRYNGLASVASVASGAPREDDSSDPHDFYRRYEAFTSIRNGGMKQADLVSPMTVDGMTTARQRSRRPSPAKIRTNGTKFPSISSRYPSTPSSSDKSPLSATKSTPALSNTTRNRQTSLRDLVDKFNTTPDQIPPLPSQSQSRSASTSSNPQTRNYARARTSSQSKVFGQALPNQGQRSGSQQRRGRTEDESYSGSQSLADLSADSCTKPLFGEIVLNNLNNLRPGYGISHSRRRRGSEGNMHRPNAMFPDERFAQRSPPSEDSTHEKDTLDFPPGLHRRTRSDFTGVQDAPPTRFHSAFSNSTANAPPFVTSHHTSRRDSFSRIPLSSRRLSAASESGTSTPSTRNNSALGRNPSHAMSPKASSAIPVYNQQPRSPTANPHTSTSRKSPRRDMQLNAFISAPLPKKSPPLRSSRPRQPVSSASTSASRARAVEKYETGNKSPSKSLREPKHRRPPELGGLDFAARREKIQRAFTKSVRAEEKRRASVAQQTQLRESYVATGDGALDEQAHESDGDHNQDEAPSQDVLMGEEDVLQTPGEEAPKTERQLTISTGHLSERSVLDLSQEDSPTLGVIGHLNRVSEGDTSDFEPSSAVTAGTSDSVDTFFDDEPQEDEEAEAPVPELDQKPQAADSGTLLSHIMSMRDRSPPSPTNFHHPAVVDDISSERDDRESIQIMLGEAPVLEKPPYVQRSRGEGSNHIPDSDAAGSRWSMSSSVKSKDNEREGPMERIEENSPSRLRPHNPAHLSTSTVTSESTQQPWSPATFTSPQTNRSTIGTMDSDAYSTINRVLDHYHDPSIVSPKMMHDVQQQIFTQSPDLARQGGWDPKKVTQLYLQQLARERAMTRGSSLPDPHKYRRKPLNSQSPTSAPRETNDAQNEKILSPSPSASHSRNTSLGVDDGDFTLTHRASMNHPDDWDMSPSIADWIAPQAEDSPSDDRAPQSSESWEHVSQELAAQERPRTSETHHPQLPEIKGGLEPLGLAINITSPQDDDSPTIPPPLPDHVPPPPPNESPVQNVSSPQPYVPSMPLPGVPSKAITSAAVRPRVASDVPSLPNQASNESSRQSGTTVSSIPPSSSSFSQERNSADTQITSAESVKVDPAEQKRLTKRRHIIKELVDTEHSFGQDMKVVDDIYKGTSNVIIISAEDVKTLFCNSDQIVGFSTQFLDALKQASKSVYVLPKSKRWRSNRESNMTNHSLGTDESSLHGAELSDEDKDRRTSIGEAFGQHMAHMEKVYSEYLKNHDAANQKLQILQKNEKVQIWLKECRAYAHDLTSAWDLDSLLVKPVQRILKYPLLLNQLLESTPENHPDFAQLDIAAREMKGISMRINDMKKRADIMEQVTNTRKRNQSDVRVGLSKAFGRRTEKLRQQVGLSDMVDDAHYNAVSEKFGSHFFQLQVVMRDVEMYTNDVQMFMRRFLEFSHAMEEHIDVAQSSYPESESKWRKFRMSMTEMTVTALTDHVNAVRKNVIEPMTTLLKLHDGPQKLMQKRNKRVMDYARYKAIKDRGDKLDKKTAEQGEQYVAVNDTLKEELPRLFSLTGKLVEACLNNFIQLQLQWQAIWKRKLGQAVDDLKVPSNGIEIISAFTGDFQFFEAQVLSLGICNGSMLAEAANLVGFLSPTTTFNSEDIAAARTTPATEHPRHRTTSVSSDLSPVLPQPDFGGREGGGLFGSMASGSVSTTNVETHRMRASSAVSNNSPQTPDIPGSYRSYSNSTTPSNPPARRPNTATGRSSLQSPGLNRPSVDGPDYARMSEHSAPFVNRPPSGQTYPQIQPPRSSSPTGRYSGIFSSAMPMSDSPRTESPVDSNARKDFKVLFLAASVYEFNIDRARREAGYPYLTYVAGEIFDVIGEKGELWLAKNQDDATCQLGWIWNKHFVKLAS